MFYVRNICIYVKKYESLLPQQSVMIFELKKACQVCSVKDIMPDDVYNDTINESFHYDLQKKVL